MNKCFKIFHVVSVSFLFFFSAQSYFRKKLKRLLLLLLRKAESIQDLAVSICRGLLQLDSIADNMTEDTK